MPRTRDGIRQPLLLPDVGFAGFGPSRFRPAVDSPTGLILRGRTQPRLRAQVRASAPKRPGVYGMLDAQGRVIYIGKAKNLRSRLMSYFRVESRDPKAGKILKHTRTLMWEETADEFSALLRELELIRRFRPRFNVLGQPGQQRYVYMCLGRPPAPQVYLSARPATKDVAAYGPLVGRGHLDDAVRCLNDWFGLRDCPSTTPMSFADQPGLFPGPEPAARCLRYDIRTCLGPCAGLCTRKEYSAKVRAAKEFLDGRSATLLRDLERRMQTAAAELRFEQASRLRDRLQTFTRLNDRLTLLRSARKNHSFVYPLAGPDGRTVWYLIDRGEVCAAVRPPEDDPGRVAVRETLNHIYAGHHPGVSAGDGCADSVLLVAAWFRKYADEKAKLLSHEQALAGLDAAL